MARIKHGHTVNYHRSRLYITWTSMNHRCNNSAGKDFHHYGGRGITICDRWREFETFVQDIVSLIGNHPGKGWTFDRIRNNEGYKPDNVQWATQKTQCRNQRRVKLTVEKAAAIRTEYDTGNVSYSDLAWSYGVSKPTIAKVITGRTWV